VGGPEGINVTKTAATQRAVNRKERGWKREGEQSGGCEQTLNDFPRTPVTS